VNAEIEETLKNFERKQLASARQAG
jgi:hypothetical protein